jgi:hypothetical protein
MGKALRRLHLGGDAAPMTCKSATVARSIAPASGDR